MPMASTLKKRKASKGTVQVKSSNNRLQLVFSYSGKRHYLTLGLPDTRTNRKVAEAKAKLIEADIAFDRFDQTLDKYRPQSQQRGRSSSDGHLTLGPLWEQFVEFKRPQCSPNTMISTYGTFSGYVNRLPTHDLGRAMEIREYVLANIPLDAAKRFMTRLSACCDWAIEADLIADNPFQGMAAKIKKPKSVAADGLNDINPFSLQERDAIIQAIETDRFCSPRSAYKHSCYAPLVKFLFATGCRPSEAAALQWDNISRDCQQITFSQAVVLTETGKRIRQGLKTQEQRKFPCNSSLSALLKSIKPEDIDPTTLVFPSPKNKPIDLNNFRNRTWELVLKGLSIEYRKLYQTRHTFITHALETGKLDAKDVARLVGNSPEVIYKYYAGKKRELEVPEF
jgi:integrase